MYSIFFDQNNNFQWTSIAAIASFLAFFSSLIAIVVTSIQGKKNRKSTTIVNLRIQELKDLREQGAALVLLIRDYINERKVISNPGNTTIINTDPIINELDRKLSKLYSKVYRYTFEGSAHGSELLTNIYMYKFLLFNLNSLQQLAEIEIKLHSAIEKYSRDEYKEINKIL
ncbi:hypothetical protein OCF19_21855 [Bacillus cereus]|uniref:hypothetical protein n=1 Tax=Bacillus cereus TaxID=1396 RepID=UPI0025AF5B06|nr:hypothetical protein [Bacillus cereus]MCU4812780.1 hypothetical protein [Bacillus cereus]WJX08185.1 hypothetical protein QTA68_30340 [Bacillus cereus]